MFGLRGPHHYMTTETMDGARPAAMKYRAKLAAHHEKK